VVPRDRTNGDRHKPKHMKFHVDISKHFFIVRVTKDWHSLPSEIVSDESPMLEIFKSHPDMVLGSLFYVALLELEGWAR